MFPREGKYIKAFFERHETMPRVGGRHQERRYPFVSDIKETFSRTPFHLLLISFVENLKIKKKGKRCYRCNPPTSSVFLNSTFPFLPYLMYKTIVKYFQVVVALVTSFITTPTCPSASAAARTFSFVCEPFEEIGKKRFFRNK